jgi:uncharacterized protein (DUF1015 family)
MHGESNMARRRTELVKLNLRFPEALRRNLEREAKNKNHSLNTEIVERLYRSFQSKNETDLVAHALIGALDGAVLERMLEIIHEDEASMVAYDDWKESSR